MSTGKLSSAAVLRLPAGPLAAHPDRSLDEWALLCRVDGRRPLAALPSRPGRSLTEVVAVAERLLAAGLVEHVADAEQDTGARPEAESAGAERDDLVAEAGSGDAESGGPELDGAEPPQRGGHLDEDDRTAEAGPDLPEGDADSFPEPAGPAAAGADGPAAEEARIDSVSLLRELASESAAAPQRDEPGADQAWEELASRLTGDQEEGTVAREGGQAQDAPPGEGSGRPPGRPGDQAAFMREFASLATDDEQPDASQPPTPESDGEQPEDRSRGGRFGFRKGQRR